MNKSNLRLIIFLLCFAVFSGAVILFYSLIHESGHALAILIFGGTVEKFTVSFINSHVVTTDLFCPEPAKAFVYAAGTLLPSLFFCSVFAFYKRNVKFKSSKAGRLAYHLCFSVFAVTFLFPLLAWIFFPFDGDSYYFITVTRWQPFLVSLCALACFSCLVFFVVKKGLPSALIKSLKEISNRAEDENSVQKTVPKYKKITAVTIAFSLAFTAIGAVQSLTYKPPEITLLSTGTITMENAEDAGRDIYTFEAKLDGEYYFVLDCKKKWLRAPLYVLDEAGGQVYNNVEYHDWYNFRLSLSKGRYKVAVYYIASTTVWLNHLTETNYNGYLLSYAQNMHFGDDFSIEYSIRVSLPRSAPIHIF